MLLTARKVRTKEVRQNVKTNMRIWSDNVWAEPLQGHWCMCLLSRQLPADRLKPPELDQRQQDRLGVAIVLSNFTSDHTVLISIPSVYDACTGREI